MISFGIFVATIIMAAK
ncbi:hypothetical protein [Veillonella sp. S13053-19]